MAKKTCIGVEIGNSRIKIAETRDASLVRFMADFVPENTVRQGEIIQWEAMGDFLKDTLKRGGFSGKKAALAVPDELVFTRRIRMPAMSAAQLEVNLPYEFHDFISDDKEKYFYDYSMIGLIRNEEDLVTEMELVGVAVSKELMDNYVHMFKRAGLKLVSAAPANRALENLTRRLNPAMGESDFALLDLGSNATVVDIFSNGIYQVTRSIETGCRMIAEAAADVMGTDPHIAELYIRENREQILSHERCQELYSQIAIDVMRAINYYTFENRDNTLETIYYFGGGSYIQPLINEIADTIPLQLIPLADMANVELTNVEAVMNGAAACGICYN